MLCVSVCIACFVPFFFPTYEEELRYSVATQSAFSLTPEGKLETCNIGCVLHTQLLSLTTVHKLASYIKGYLFLKLKE